MKQPTLCIVAALAAALSASADAGAAGERPDYAITPPAGWTEMPAQASAIRGALFKESHFGGVEIDATAQAWLLADEGGSLVVSWMSTRGAVEDPDGTLWRQRDRLRDLVGTADVEAGTTREVAWKVALRDGAAEANLEWRHERNETLTIARALLYPVRQGGGVGVRQVSAECVLRLDTVAKVRPACEAALATLTLTLPLEPRIALVALAPPAEPPVRGAKPTTSAGATASSSGPSMGEPGSGVPPPRMIVVPPKAQSKDHRLLYLVGGLLVIGGLWFAFRYKRLGTQGAEAEGGSDGGDGGDDDADELSKAAAAAEGKGKNGASHAVADDEDEPDDDDGADEDDDDRPVKS